MATTHIHNTPPNTTVHKTYNRTEDSSSAAALWVILALALLAAIAYAFWDRDATTTDMAIVPVMVDSGTTAQPAAPSTNSTSSTTTTERGVSVDDSGLNSTTTERTTTTETAE